MMKPHHTFSTQTDTQLSRIILLAYACLTHLYCHCPRVEEKSVYAFLNERQLRMDEVQTYHLEDKGKDLDARITLTELREVQSIANYSMITVRQGQAIPTPAGDSTTERGRFRSGSLDFGRRILGSRDPGRLHRGTCRLIMEWLRGAT